METEQKASQVEVLAQVINLIEKLEPDQQKKILKMLATYFSYDLTGHLSASVGIEHRQDTPKPTFEMNFSDRKGISPKDFMRDKSPKTDVERVACLAYFLTHYRDTAHFKTLDISALNTEAALAKFSNAAVAVDNAMKGGILVQATKGAKQLSIAGESFVQALPDRELAQANLRQYRLRKRIKKAVTKKKP